MSVILVPVGTTPAESKRYFGELYDWLAVLYDGVVGRMLVDRFNVTTVPAIVLLDASGKVICANGRAHIATDRLGDNFPWRAHRSTSLPTVDFDLPPGA
jgi:hypothetical protein